MLDFLKRKKTTRNAQNVETNLSKVSYKTNAWWYNKAKIDRWIKEKKVKRKEKERLFKEMKRTEKKMTNLTKKGKTDKADELGEYLAEIRKEYSAIKV